MFRGRPALLVSTLLLLGVASAAANGPQARAQEPPAKPAPAKPPTAKPPTAKPPAARPPAGDEQVPEDAAKLLRKLLSDVAAEGARLERVERSVERQTRVMYDLARSDLAHARDMYCDAGDAVLDRFDAKASEAENLTRMQAELEEQLPRARELGCLNHVENDEVFSVDIAMEAIPEAGREAFEKAARQAVREREVERFLAPPLHPEAYHFEFRRK